MAITHKPEGMSLADYSKHRDLEHIAYAEVLGNENEENPMSCGLFTISQGEPSASKYPGDEFCIVLEGELDLEDTDKPGEIMKLMKGDIVRIDKATKVKWSSPSNGTGFYVHQHPHGAGLEQHAI